MVRFRKALVSAFIAVVLAAQVLPNAAVGYFGDRTAAGQPVALVTAIVDRLRWGVDTFAFYSSTNTYWRMFSPVHRYDWWWRVVATDAAGADRELSVPVVKASATSSMLLDFREAKTLLNLWTRPPMQAAYLDHWCRFESAAGRRAAAVRLEMYWREILPPDTAVNVGTHRGSMVNSRVVMQRACS